MAGWGQIGDQVTPYQPCPLRAVPCCFRGGVLLGSIHRTTDQVINGGPTRGQTSYICPGWQGLQSLLLGAKMKTDRSSSFCSFSPANNGNPVTSGDTSGGSRWGRVLHRWSRETVGLYRIQNKGNPTVCVHSTVTLFGLGTVSTLSGSLFGVLAFWPLAWRGVAWRGVSGKPQASSRQGRAARGGRGGGVITAAGAQRRAGTSHQCLVRDMDGTASSQWTSQDVRASTADDSHGTWTQNSAGPD